MLCPCTSQNEFENCCEPILQGEPAKTAEALMRARYTAYTQVNMAFIESSHDPATRKKIDMEENRVWAEQTQWKNLDIIESQQGSENDDWGQVEFKAEYRAEGQKGVHHEVAEFKKKKGVWYFSKGLTPENFQIVNTEPKIGRNDPCLCGSGKKYKKCCG